MSYVSYISQRLQTQVKKIRELSVAIAFLRVVGDVSSKGGCERLLGNAAVALALATHFHRTFNSLVATFVSIASLLIF